MIYIGLGSNLGDRLQNLRSALASMVKAGIKVLKVSPVYENPALLPPKAPVEWNKDFLNAVCEVSVDNTLTAPNLLKKLKAIEKNLGRGQAPRHAPRVLDLDILLFKNQVLNTKELTIPHLGLRKRNFVLAGLKDIHPQLDVLLEDGTKTTALALYRKIKNPLPAFMQIVNITPDSFSDGARFSLPVFEHFLKQIKPTPLNFLDLGAESTRPGAKPLSAKEEWARLKPYLEIFFSFYGQKDLLRPRLSIDTYHPETAEKAMALGADVINDVSGLSDEMLNVLSTSEVDYVLTHSVTVPVSRTHTLPLDVDPVEEIKTWLRQKLSQLEQRGINFNRIIFDPGIGFGKTSLQSLEVLRRIKEFLSFPVRIMVGHSRKSFMLGFADKEPHKRDPESAGISLYLANRGVDILRVHSVDLHARVFRGHLL